MQWLGAAVATLAMLPVPAQAMTAAEWMQRWDVLRRQGPAAMKSPELRVLQTAIGEAAGAYRAEVKAAQAAGRVPRSCPPARVSVSSEDVTAELRKLPPALLASELRIAFAAVMDRRYPCPPGYTPRAVRPKTI